jgi:hypothetical protein
MMSGNLELMRETLERIKKELYYTVGDAGAPGYGEVINIGMNEREVADAILDYTSKLVADVFSKLANDKVTK